MRNYPSYDLKKVGNLTEDQQQFLIAMQNVEQEENNLRSSGWQGPYSRKYGNFKGKHNIPRM